MPYINVFSYKIVIIIVRLNKCKRVAIITNPKISKNPKACEKSQFNKFGKLRTSY